ncbi:hypothetical protein C5167_001289 [Papaver somniferum]|uniref:Large ribosomal subunit protein uL4 C-terminal domain-containing protein n=1 Tax=Papaver somniferum TaxID=3469 RepID=A0A4Y7KUV0_PAPSO|nr:hypothetical protein C5167_001289 [Papaver somniferum]
MRVCESNICKCRISCNYTNAAIKVLEQLGDYADAEKVKESEKIRPGTKIAKAFRNIPGVDLANVEILNLLKLAPGGHLGRFIIWTKSTFEKLDSIYGSFEKSSEKKKGYVLPRSKMVNADLARIINSDEVQSVVKPIKKDSKRASMKKNPVMNLNSMWRLDPYAKTTRRMALLAEDQRVKSKKEKLEKKRTNISKDESAANTAAGKAWYQTMISDSDYTEFDVF